MFQFSTPKRFSTVVKNILVDHHETIMPSMSDRVKRPWDVVKIFQDLSDYV